MAKATARFKNQVKAGYHEPLCQSHVALCTDVYTDLTDDYVGHDEPSVLFKSDAPGLGQRRLLRHPAPEGPPGTQAAERRLREHLELRAPADVLVRDDALRQRVVAGVHARRARRTPTRTTSSAPTRTPPTTSGSTPGTRSWRSSSTGRATCRSSRVRLLGAPVLRRDDDRQPDPQPEHEQARDTPTASTTSSAASSRSTGPTSPRAACPRRRPTRSTRGRSPTRTSTR